MAKIITTFCCLLFVCLGISTFDIYSQETVSNHIYENEIIAGQMAYIKEHRELAVEEMLYCGMPASVKLAQALLETQYGTSILATRGTNHFGIKCKVDWTGDIFFADDDEIGECFRKYPTVRESYRDHSNFLKFNRLKFYDKLFKIPIDDYEAWCYGLQESGYATAVTYARSLIRIIKRFKLYELDAYHLDSKMNIATYKEHTPTGELVTVEPVQKSKISCVHIVRKGETLNQIARIYKVNVNNIIQLNSFNKGEVIKEGQAIKLN